MRHMGPWSCEEILAARDHIFNDQPIANVKGRFSKWGGIPRYIFQDTDAVSQALLKNAIDTFGLDSLSNIMIEPNMRSSEQAFAIGHKIVHMTVEGNYLRSPVVFASEWVREELISRLLRLLEHEVRDFLEDRTWGMPEFLAFREAFRERHRALHKEGKP